MTYKSFLSQAGTAAAIVLLATACKGAGAASAPASNPSSAGSASASGPASASAAASSMSPASAAVPAISASPSGSSAPSASAAAATPQSCQSWAASHTFAEVYDSTFHQDGSLTIHLHPATVSCGGPDDLHYDVSAKTATATVAPPGTVQMLVTTATGPADRSVSHADFDARLGADRWGRIFMVTGPLTAITALKEMYHP